MGAIDLRNVTVTYGDVVAVDAVDLAVAEGELLVLVGPSGCGKTTLLRTIAGLETPDAGEVSVGGRRVTDLPARKRDVSLVFQDNALFPHLSVRENLSFDLRMQGYDRIAERVEAVADRLEIGALLDRRIDALSGGQQQRVALGRSLATEPAAFLLDEPLANLDAGLRERMRTEIGRLQADLGVTTVHVTHDQREALTMGDRVAVMRDGRVEQVGTPEAVYRRPASLFVAEFVGSPSMNRFEGRYDPDASAVTIPGDGRGFTVPVVLADDTDDVVVGVRPEPVVVESRAVDDSASPPDDGASPVDDGPSPLDDGPAPTDDGPPTRDAGIRTTATVSFEEFHGADRYLYLDSAGLAELVARVAGETAVGVGDAVAVGIPAGRLHYFDAGTGRRLDADGVPADPVGPPEREWP